MSGCAKNNLIPHLDVTWEGFELLKPLAVVSVMTIADLLRGAVAGCISEARFTENFFKLFRDPRISGAEARCLNELVDDVNMAEHIGPLFDGAFVWKAGECLRLLSEGTSASEIRRFFATNSAP